MWEFGCGDESEFVAVKKTSAARETGSETGEDKETERSGDTAFSAGDCVRLKADRICPDDDSLTIGGWQGRVLGRDGDGVDVAWDRWTLESMPLRFLYSSEREGLSWREMRLDADDLEPARTRDSEPEVAIARRQIEQRIAWWFLPVSKIRSQASSRSYRRGAELHDRGAVKKLRFDGRGYQAKVQGTELYTVTIQGEPEAVEASCDCPYDHGGECKHVAAALLSIREEHRSAEPASSRPESPERGIDAVLAGLDAPALRRFLQGQLALRRGMEEDLRIFAQGSVESTTPVEEYTRKLERKLSEVEFPEPEEDRYGWHDEEENDRGATAVAMLAWDLRQRALKYQQQGNDGEALKIHESILRAFCRFADDFERHHGIEAPYECQSEARTALKTMAGILSGFVGADREGRLDRFATLICERLDLVDARAWEMAFEQAFGDPQAARGALEAIGEEGARLLNDTTKSPAILGLLERSGDRLAFIEAAMTTSGRHPRVAPRLVEALLEEGRRQEAIDLARDRAKRPGSEEGPGPLGWDLRRELDEARLALLRFLITVCDRKGEKKLRAEAAGELALETGDLDDYRSARDALTSKRAREELLRRVKKRCETVDVARILHHEKRTEDLLELARERMRDSVFPQIVPLVFEAYPEECFELFKERLDVTLAGGASDRLYRSASRDLRQMLELGVVEDKLWPLLDDLVAEYPGRINLKAELADLIERSAEWYEKRRREVFASTKLEDLAEFELSQLIKLCPVTEKDRAAIEKTTVAWQKASAQVVWALLVKSGGRMDSKEITRRLMETGGDTKARANSRRSAGLRILETLGLAEVDRVKNRLKEARLTRLG